ncbi:MAG: ABC transporter substrate-binding protein [Burkholderiaceae bacterium]|nr:ABC transporter substrate-binding protein [Burkholderiaceae bacterium]MBP7659150.1 ABC transporter substrate-binding protein [Burkholderiaceae bacterium]
MTLMKQTTLAIAAAALVAASASVSAQQGVTKTEILIGSIQDLSGPIAALGKQTRNGMQLRVDEINEQGGINGRKLKLMVEDNGYDPKKAVLAAQKLVNQDKVFLVAGHMGTAQNNAAMPIQFEKNVINFLPVTAAREMYEPFHKLKFSFAATYFDQMRAGLPVIMKQKNYAKPCIIYQDDEFGLEVARGAEDALKSMGKGFTEKTTYKRGATDFSSQVARMKSAGCDLVVMGTILRETIGTMGEARKTGFSPDFFGSSAVYNDLVHKLGGKVVDGLYGMHTTAQPYADTTDEKIRFWSAKYRTKFSEDPTVFSAYGYAIIDNFSVAARAAGPNLTVDSFVKALETNKIPADMFGSPALQFKPNMRLGNDQSRMSQIQNGRWTSVSGYLVVPPLAK